MSDPIIKVENVGIRFNIASEKIESLKEYVIKLVKRELYFKEFWALQDVSFEVKCGESLAIIGGNGAGKSTLLKLLCRILDPDNGTVTVNGVVMPLIELGAGLDPDLSAEENIWLGGALLGYSKKEIQKHHDKIVEFAELGNFMHMPIKNYSSGMYARLAFSLATMKRADILIVDEILSVGDIAFQKKCTSLIKDMLAQGTTLLYVSHSPDSVQKLCQKALWLKKGRVEMQGDVGDVYKAYSASMRII